MISATLSTFEYYVAEHTDNGISRIPERVAKDAVAALSKMETLREALVDIRDMPVMEQTKIYEIARAALSEKSIQTSDTSASPRPAAADAGVREALSKAVKVLAAIRDFCGNHRVNEYLNHVSALGVDAAIIRAEHALSLAAKRGQTP
jgi:hypothetical protein